MKNNVNNFLYECIKFISLYKIIIMVIIKYMFCDTLIKCLSCAV